MTWNPEQEIRQAVIVCHMHFVESDRPAIISLSVQPQFYQSETGCLESPQDADVQGYAGGFADTSSEHTRP